MRKGSIISGCNEKKKVIKLIQSVRGKFSFQNLQMHGRIRRFHPIQFAF